MGGTIYFCADHHWGSKAMATERGFDSVEDMDEYMIQRWRERISDADVVVILGDLFVHHPDPAAILSQLPGHKILIRGNHDMEWLNQLSALERACYFDGITDLLSCNFGFPVTLCHWPMISYERSREQGVLVCGHIHGLTAEESLEAELFSKVPLALNAGIDINQLHPVSFRELITNNQKYYQKFTSENLNRLFGYADLIEAIEVSNNE